MKHNRKFNFSVLFMASLMILAFSSPADVCAFGWEQLGLAGRTTGKIAVHPDTPDTIFVIGGDSLFRSEDGGVSFAAVFGQPNGNNLSAVTVSPLDPANVLVADEGNFLGGNAHVYFSTNAGDTWGEFPFTYMSITDLESDPSTGSDFYVTTTENVYRRDQVLLTMGAGAIEICTADNQFIVIGIGDTLGIGVSTDGGGTWSYSADGLPADGSTEITTIALHPTDCTTMFVGLRTGVNPADFLAYSSNNSGVSFESLGWQSSLIRDSEIDPTVGASGIAYAAYNQGVMRLPLDNPVFSDLSAGLVGNALTVNGITAVDGSALFAGTNDGIWTLNYLPNLMSVTRKIDDTASGDGSGSAEPGEQFSLSVYLYNTLFIAEGLTGTLSTSDANVTIDDADATFPDIQALSADANSADPFLITVSPSAEYGHRADFDLALTSNSGGYNDTLSFNLEVGRHIIMIVDDDGGSEYEIYYTTTLDTLDQTDSLSNIYDRWDVNAYGAVTGVLQEPWTHDPVIWYTGSTEENTLTTEDQVTVMNFLNGGGNILLTGHSLAEDLAGGTFLEVYLGIDTVKTNLEDPICNGLPGDPVSGNMKPIVTQGASGANNQREERDVLSIADPQIAMESIAYDTTTMSIAAVRIVTGTGRCYFIGFGFEAVTSSGSPAFESRVEMMTDILRWLRHPVDIEDGSDGPSGAVPRVFALNQNYPNPFNPQTSISFTVPGNEGDLESVSLRVYSVRGRLLKTLIDETRESGVYTAVWDGRDEVGRKASSGIYFYRLEAGEKVAVRKMVILK
jgi:hypothetical protein